MSAPLAGFVAVNAAPRRRRLWLERWFAARNQLLANARFQHWAARFPLTRWIARRRARALFDLVGGFVYSQILSACVQLRLFDRLAAGPKSIPDLALSMSLTEAATERLLKAAAALSLTQALGDSRYGLGHLGAALRGNPSVMAMIEHHAMLYADLADPVALLRATKPESELARYWAYARNADPSAISSDRVAAYSGLMADSQALVANEIIDAYPLSRHRCLLDIGGGDGVFLTAVAARNSHLSLMLFDLPAVTTRAHQRFAAAGLLSRAAIFGGSFFTDALPQGADVASLVRVLHDHDDDAALEILRRAHAALPSSGILLVAEPMSGTPGAEPIGDAYFGFYFAAMGSGRCRTPKELSDLLSQAGFRHARLISTSTPLVVRLISAIA